MSALSIDQVRKRIADLPAMSELDRSEFCEEGGIADSLAQKFGKEDLKPTQLYRVFQELKRIERGVRREIRTDEDLEKDFDRNLVIPLLPVMAYNSARGHLPRDFYEIIRNCLSPQKLHTNGDFLRVVELISAVLAYHKFRSG